MYISTTALPLKLYDYNVINPATDLIDVLIIYTTGYEQASYSFQFSIDAESFKCMYLWRVSFGHN